VRVVRVVRVVVAAMVVALGAGGAGPANPPPPACADGQVRAVWIATVQNIDWPSRPGLPAADQQREYRALLDEVQRLGLNTVIVQVRPTADALWPSPYEPWSHWLTGRQGADPGYDPLAFLVEEAHARGLRFHAWFNPFRVSRQADPAQLVPDHPARRHPERVFAYGGQLYYDPGRPDVRDFVVDVVLDVARRYPVDGVHFDDYFYPYPVEGEELPDAGTFAEFGSGFTDVGDWRRHNVDELVRATSQRLAALDRDIEFGISPFGIWRNRSARVGDHRHAVLRHDLRRHPDLGARGPRRLRRPADLLGDRAPGRRLRGARAVVGRRRGRDAGAAVHGPGGVQGRQQPGVGRRGARRAPGARPRPPRGARRGLLQREVAHDQRRRGHGTGMV